MSAIAGAALLIGGCLVLMRAFRLAERALASFEGARAAARVLASITLTDYQKEVVLKRYTRVLMLHSLVLVVGGVSSIAVPLLAIWLLDALQLARFGEVLDTATSWQFLFATLAILALTLAGPGNRRCGWRSAPSDLPKKDH